LAIDRSTFRPDSRWLASMAGISVDRVNISLQTLLRCGHLRMLSRDQWVMEGRKDSNECSGGAVAACGDES
jgi:hypothetical protein